jgi:hypothetical protein
LFAVDVLHAEEQGEQSHRETQQHQCQSRIRGGSGVYVACFEHVGILPNHIAYQGQAAQLRGGENNQQGEHIPIPLVFSPECFL